MKKTAALVIVFAFVFCFAAPVFANPLTKLTDGFKDILTSPYELVKHTDSEVRNADFKPYGFFYGFLKGTGHFLQQSVYGAVDVATFPLDLE